MAEIPDVPDPSATEAPQFFGSSARSQLRDRVFEAVESEIGEDGVTEDTEPEVREPDRVVDPNPVVGARSTTTLWLFGAVVLFFVAALVFAAASVVALAVAVFVTTAG